MSPERTEYYLRKQRKMAFFIAENDKQKSEENPPTVSAVIGLDKILEAAFIASRRAPLKKKSPDEMNAGMKINPNIISNRNSKKISCPGLPTQWRTNLNLIIPKAEFEQISY